MGASADTALVLATTGATIALITAVIAAIAAAISTCIAAWQGLLMKRSEQNRTQPIVVAYERGEPVRKAADLIFAVSLANEGAGPAFNVRFGIAFDGIEQSYTAQPAGAHGYGDVPRALGPGRTLPAGVEGSPTALHQIRRVPQGEGGLIERLNGPISTNMRYKVE
jgi:hypothetical protein